MNWSQVKRASDAALEATSHVEPGYNATPFEAIADVLEAEAAKESET